MKRLVLAATSAVFVGALLSVWFVGTASADSAFVPVLGAKMCNAMPAAFVDPQIAGPPVCVENKAVSASADTTITLDIPSGLPFSTVATFSPNGSTITSGSLIPAGTKIGGLRSTSTLGILNGLCNTVLTIEFVLFNVALPNNTGNPRASTNLAYPEVEGTTNRFGRWKVGSPPGGGDPSGITAGASAFHAAGTSIPIQNYPKYLLDAFDPDFVPGVGDGPAIPLMPTAVYGGVTNVVGNWIPLYFVQFGSGQLTTLPAPYSLMVSAMGQPSVSVLGDTTATVASPSTINDLCTPQSVTTVLLGKDPTNTFTRSTSPAVAGTHYVFQYAASGRDTDQDGFENTLDTCPKNPDIGSPKLGGGDSDNDGIDDACDPGGLATIDVDSDGFQNRQDNCPLLANSTQVEADVGTGPFDLGPERDAIGDPCDSGIASITQNGRPVTITMSSAIANGRYHVVSRVVPICFGGLADLDNDGYCGAADNADSGACATTPSVPTVPPSPPGSCHVRHAPWGTTHPGRQMDTDGDGTSDAVETYMGTDATKSCAQTPVPPSTAGGANDEGPLDNWPLDFDDNRLAGLSDVLKLSAPFGQPVNGTVGSPSTRLDLNHDGLITLPDVLTFSAPFGQRCGAGAPLSIPHWSQQ